MPSFFKKRIMKQFRLVLCCLLIMGIVLSLLCYTVIERLMTKNSTAYAQSTAQKFNVEVKYLFDRADALFSSLLFNENIEQIMHTPFSAKTPSYLNALHTQFSSYRLMNAELAELAEIALVTPEMSWSSYFDAATLRAFSEEMRNLRGTTCFGLQQSPLTARAGSQEQRLVFGHNVYGMFDDSLYGQYLGSIILSLDLSKSSIQLPLSERSATCFVLLDQNGTAFPFNCSDEQYQQIQEQGLAAGHGTWPMGACQTEDYLIYNTPLNDTGLFMVSAMDRHALSKEGLPTIAILIVITTAALIVVVLLMSLMLQSVVRPLSQLSAYIDRIRLTPPGADAEPLELQGCEEITRLCSSFNTMLREQARLTRELQQATVNLYEMQLGRKQAELEYLRSQINPHFLYNTLEAIQGIALEHGVPKIADAAGALGKLFRHNIQGSDMIPLGKELEITQAYLTIQKLRFADKLNVLISIRENTRGIPVMKLLLQPLVENAVYHGLEPKTGPGTLFIGARLEKGDLLISIYDDGVGMPSGRLAALQEELERPAASGKAETAHIGLLNVQHRIRLRYGMPYGLTLHSTPGGGTRVTVRVPAQIQEEENELC